MRLSLGVAPATVPKSNAFSATVFMNKINSEVLQRDANRLNGF
jgi:hypothetical protein